MSGIEAWQPDGTKVIDAADQLGLIAGYVEIGNGYPVGSIYHRLLTLGNPYFIYMPANVYTYAPSIVLNKSNGTLSWNGSNIPSSVTWAGSIHYGSY